MSAEKKTPSTLITISLLSGALTLIFSLIYTGLSTVTLVLRFSCDLNPLQSLNPSEVFINALHKAYILDAECDTSVSPEGITSDYSVFVLTTITLVASVVTLIAAVTLLAVSTSADTRYLNIIIYVYLGVCVCSLIVDITFASHFGMDFTYLTTEMDKMSANPDIVGIIMNDYLRLGALLLMSVCLKGYIGHLVNLVLLVLLTIFVVQYRQELNKAEHSIHKLGAVHAFESTDKNESCNHQCEICQRNRNGKDGSQINYGYVNNDETPRSRSPVNNISHRPEYPNSMYDRSNSWQPSPAGSSRPFSYLEDMKRPPPLVIPAPLPSPSASDSNWRRDRWQTGPPVPAPDYSPHAQRRLKSALKSYM